MAFVAREPHYQKPAPGHVSQITHRWNASRPKQRNSLILSHGSAPLVRVLPMTLFSLQGGSAKRNPPSFFLLRGDYILDVPDLCPVLGYRQGGVVFVRDAFAGKPLVYRCRESGIGFVRTKCPKTNGPKGFPNEPFAGPRGFGTAA